MLGRHAAFERIEPTRVVFGDAVTERDLEGLAGDPWIKVLQCSAPVSDSTWERLNTHFFAQRPDVQLRVYGHYWTECDLRFATRMTNVRRFAADCLMQATYVECIAAIPNLRDATCLRRIVLQNLKGLSDFSEFEWAPALEEFALVEGSTQEPEQLLPVLRNRSVRRASAWFWSERKNQQFSLLRAQSGKDEANRWAEFEYR
jgi:hypothetical protein